MCYGSQTITQTSDKKKEFERNRKEEYFVCYPRESSVDLLAFF